MTTWAKQMVQPTPVGAGSSACAGRVTVRRGVADLTSEEQLRSGPTPPNCRNHRH